MCVPTCTCVLGEAGITLVLPALPRQLARAEPSTHNPGIWVSVAPRICLHLTKSSLKTWLLAQCIRCLIPSRHEESREVESGLHFLQVEGCLSSFSCPTCPGRALASSRPSCFLPALLPFLQDSFYPWGLRQGLLLHKTLTLLLLLCDACIPPKLPPSLLTPQGSAQTPSFPGFP